MELLDTVMVLTRVLTTGVVMSIEKNNKELPALERLLSKQIGLPFVSLVNSSTAGIHAALTGQGIGYGGKIVQPGLSKRQRAFINWLGISINETESESAPAFAYFAVGRDNTSVLAEASRALPAAPATVLDLSGLGFGPAAAVLSEYEAIWAGAERLKIFGAFDLRTMWTQEESSKNPSRGVQFNYRLSPLVAACIRMALA
jgi:hypothetical protein